MSKDVYGLMEASGMNFLVSAKPVGGFTLGRDVGREFPPIQQSIHSLGRKRYGARSTESNLEPAVASQPEDIEL